MEQAAPERRSSTSLGDEDLGDGRARGRNDRGKGRPSGATDPDGSDHKFPLTRHGPHVAVDAGNWTYVALKLDINQGWPPTHGDPPLTSLHQSIEVAL